MAIVERVLYFPSRNKGNPHMVHVTVDRKTACLSCKAGVHGRTCWAAGSLQRRLQRHGGKILRDVLTTIEQVRQVLCDHQEARDLDIDCVRWYWHDWWGILPATPYGEVLELQRRVFGSFWDDRIVRVRAHVQNKEGLFPPCDEVLAARHVHQKVMHDVFTPPQEGSA